MRRYDFHINADGDEEEYATPTGRYMHADEVLEQSPAQRLQEIVNQLDQLNITLMLIANRMPQ